MPLTMTQLETAGRLPEILVGEGSLNISYKRPTPDYIDRLAELSKTPVTPELKETFATQLVGTVTKWDFNDEKKEPFPIDAEHLLMLPIGVLRLIINQIVDMENGDPNTASPSAISS